MSKCKKKRKDFLPPPRSLVEIAKQAMYEEFWSDPCWTEPLEEKETTTEFPTKALL